MNESLTLFAVPVSEWGSDTWLVIVSVIGMVAPWLTYMAKKMNTISKNTEHIPRMKRKLGRHQRILSLHTGQIADAEERLRRHTEVMSLLGRESHVLSAHEKNELENRLRYGHPNPEQKIIRTDDESTD